jgi:DNA-3-methyladenine glycosylase I
MPRCPWATTEPNITYHDKEWGVPVHDDRLLFEFLILEGAQAGLSWTTILNKRDNYRKAFDGFRPEKIARYGACDVKNLGPSMITYGASSLANQSRIAGDAWLTCPRAQPNPTQ